MAVAARTVADVDPAAAFLIDALVHGQVEALDECQQAAVARACAHRDIGGLTALVLARGRTSDNLVQLGTAVAAVDVDGTSPCLAQRVQHVVHKGMQGCDCAGGRCVVDAQEACRVRAHEFLDGEVLHRIMTRM